MIAWLPMLVIVCSVFLFALLRRRGTLAFGLCIVSLAVLLIGYARDHSNTRHDAASNTDVDVVRHPLDVADAFLQRSQDERLRRQQTVAEITHDHDFPWASDSQQHNCFHNPCLTSPVLWQNFLSVSVRPASVSHRSISLSLIHI